MGAFRIKLVQTEICGNEIDENCNGVTNSMVCKDDPCLGPAALPSIWPPANVEHSQILFRINSAILPIDFELTYNSLDNDGSPARAGHPYNIKLISRAARNTLIRATESIQPSFRMAHNTTRRQRHIRYSQLIRIHIQALIETAQYIISTQRQDNKHTGQNAPITFAYTGNNLTAITDAAGRVTTP